ncbi:flagellar biosynthetic protein FliO [Acetobacteraceae bacterium KSS8]|uniref:Flagellar biosynthetic protein FliO n=1 Tax=Endosaccharibacter trunci TaxID=2812733 RepID=A0ABT1W9E1_9PROT|nr:flagellar biosynthetic protein FliO [Acetobacteraceae bacterium KSS8]
MSTTDLLSATGALVLVVGLIFLLRWGAPLLRPRLSGAHGARLVVAAQLALDAKRRLVLVQCDGQQLLVLSGGATDVLLPLPPAPAPTAFTVDTV